MTINRKDGLDASEFSGWLRNQKEIDSKEYGYIATNIDYMWRNYKTGLWMLIEEKRYNTKIKFPQTEMFEILDNAIKSGTDKNYNGFHKIIFQNTNPDDGEITLDDNKITKEQLIDFLKFKNILK